MTKPATEAHNHSHTSSCMMCGLNMPFDLPDQVVDAALSETLVIFAGAGVSTEVPAVLEDSIYRTIRSRVSTVDSEDFPDVMSNFTQEHGRAKLIEFVWNRFDYIRAFSELRRTATRFHRELATMPYIKDVITTNWDPYFEEECGAIPIITGADYGLRSLHGRRVYKIHGSINAISTIVATREDYTKALGELSGNALGATLRHLLATNTVVFAGYSLTDSDFRQVYDVLTSDLGEFAPTRYFVGPFESSVAQELQMTQIVTDGTFFLSKLKEAAIAKSHYLPDVVYDRVVNFREEIAYANDSLDKFDHTNLPGILYSYLYQQGARHACDRILANRIKGEYSDVHQVAHKIQSYGQLFDGAVRNGLYADAAYVDGYLNTLILLTAQPEDGEAEEDLPLPPPYFCFSKKVLLDVEDVKKSAKSLKRRDPKAWKFAKKLSNSAGANYIPQHGITLDITRIMA
jgi:hypothetical protein